MDSKTTGIVSYLTLIGWVVALVARKEKDEHSTFHLRQMFGLVLLMFATNIFYIIPEVGSYVVWVAQIIVFVLWVIAFMGALSNEKKLIPILGDKFQEWFSFLN